ILDVARRLIAQSRRDVEVVFTGLRPGEKLHEVLFSDGEDRQLSSHPLISHVQVPPLDPRDVRGDVRTLVSAHRGELGD
ncbi:MAG: polysaccharide biosynthesis protein, partial [Actinomycetes bacterium]|nr:polysaccharide biosynthesis protein [Actinomycetes bacterium]MDX5450534.1 polysaccharide biosynthesis protein [Actinomycetes bacterium]